MSMLRSVLAYMGLGPDEDYEDDYLYGSERAARTRRVGHDEDGELTIDLRDEPDVELTHGDPHSQRPRPDWIASSDFDDDPAEERSTRPVGGSSSAPAARARPRTERDARPTRSRSSRATPSPPRTEPIVSRSSGSSTAVGAAASEAFEVQTELDEAIDTPPPLRAVPNPDPVDDGLSVIDARTDPSGDRYVKPQLLAPQSFGDAKGLADLFKDATPVIMNLQGVDRDLARRLIDFASGICYALDGSMEKVASQVFLLTPASVEVSEDERERMASRAYGR